MSAAGTGYAVPKLSLPLSVGEFSEPFSESTHAMGRYGYFQKCALKKELFIDVSAPKCDQRDLNFCK